MIEEAKQYLLDNDMIIELSGKQYTKMANLVLSDRLVELLVNFTRIQLQKQHEETLKMCKNGSE